MNKGKIGAGENSLEITRGAMGLEPYLQGRFR